MSAHLCVCAVRSGQEHRLRQEIERTGFGTRMPTYRAAYRWQGKCRVVLRPLFPGYVFAYLRPGWGDLAAIHGVTLLLSDGGPAKIRGSDDERLSRLELDCAIGDFNRVQFRARNGTFEERKRKRRPRRSKRLYRSNNTYEKS